ncbi:MAG TPA: hypothetical protein VMV82_10535 [Candidatus Dormibacteraeota bacterium]|nr:hypothetical protein [Candidatus Dormibacteraeota bacterium]
MALGFAPSVRAATDPYALYERAEAFWLNQQYPRYLAYDVAVRVERGGSMRTQRYQSSFDATTGSVWVDPVSDYELAHPHVPHGINFSLSLWFIGVPIGKPEAPVDFLGVPILAPTYSFGMAPFVPAAPPSSQRDAMAIVAEVRRAFHDPYPPGRTPPRRTGREPLREIAHAVATRRVYTITLVGQESVDGHACYHLSLQPLRDPGRYRLRDLWIDERTGATWRLREALNFVDGPGTTVPWTVDFGRVAGVQYITTERADAMVRYRGETYSQVTVAFENLRAVSVPVQHPLYISPEMHTMQEPP